MQDQILESVIKFLIMLLFLYLILASATEKREDIKSASKTHAQDVDLETEQHSVIRMLILKPLFWISYIIFLLGAIASLVAALASLLSFQIFAALGFYLLYFLFKAAWCVLEDHRRMERMLNEALSGS